MLYESSVDAIPSRCSYGFRNAYNHCSPKMLVWKLNVVGDLGRTGSAAEREAREPVARRARLEHAHHPSPALLAAEKETVRPPTPRRLPPRSPASGPGFPRKPFRARQQPSVLLPGQRSCRHTGSQACSSRSINFRPPPQQAAVEPVRRRPARENLHGSHRQQFPDP